LQIIGAGVLFTLGAFAFETREIHWTGELIFAMAWLVLVLSVAAVGLLYWLIRRSAATGFGSLFHLVPALRRWSIAVLQGLPKSERYLPRSTFLVAPHMSAFGGKADMTYRSANVR